MIAAAAAAARLRGAIALATVCIVIISGVLSRHHEADVAHVTDARTGIISHAAEVDCHDGTPVSHLHALEGEQHADVCGLAAALQQPTRISHTPIVAQAVAIERATAPPVVVHVQAPLLLSAPKTSPPRT